MKCVWLDCQNTQIVFQTKLNWKEEDELEWDDDCRVGTGEELELVVGTGEQLELVVGEQLELELS